MNPHRSWFSPLLRPGYNNSPDSMFTSAALPSLFVPTSVYPCILYRSDNTFVAPIKVLWKIIGGKNRSIVRVGRKPKMTLESKKVLAKLLESEILVTPWTTEGSSTGVA
ncbi:hypothetical protein ACFX2I_030617 [Malus domestica]